MSRVKGSPKIKTFSKADKDSPAKQDPTSRRAIEIARKSGVSAAVDYLCSKARASGKEESVRLLLGAAQMIDSTDPARASRILDELLAIDPMNPVASLAKSVVMSNLGDAKSSLQALKVAVVGELDNPQRMLASLMLTKFGLLGEASKMCKNAFEAMGRPLAHASMALDIAIQVADWDFSEELISILRASHLNGTFTEAQEAAKTNILWCDDELTNLQVVENWAQRVFPNVSPITNYMHSDPKTRRIRVGYLSSDYRIHPTAFLINGLFRNHDTEKFELFMYCSGWDDGSDIRKEVVSHFDHVHSVSNLNDEEAAKLIHSHGLDILVELNGATKSNRLGILAFRPAPVQICYLGWPGSVGGRFVDYIIADDYILSEERAGLYPEKILWLSGTYQINDYAALPPLGQVTKHEYGFQESELVLGMFNTINKVSRRVWTAWMDILRECPNAKLWVLDPGPDVRENLAKETIAAGIDLDRVVMGPKLPFRDHLKRMQVCDLVLDPWPIGGHTSAADALYAKVPLLSMEGNSYASRVGGSLLRAAGLEGLVQPDRDTYIGFAIGLLRNPTQLARLKAMVSQSIMEQPIFNASNKTREIEALYLHLASEEGGEGGQSHENKTIEPAFIKNGKKLNICVASLPGYSHSHAFDELTELIYYASRELGYDCRITQNEFSKKSTNIILGAHLLSMEGLRKIPKGSIIFNTEQLLGVNANWKSKILSSLENNFIWDYSDQNIDYLGKCGFNQPSKFRFGYQPQLDRLQKNRTPRISVLFYGSITERRASILTAIRRKGIEPVIVTNLYGGERDKLISDSKIVLNLHAYESKVFEIIRLSYLLNNGIPIFTEIGGVETVESAFVSPNFKASAEDVPSKLLKALESDRERVASGLDGKRAFMSSRQSELLRPILEACQ